jgi:parallel beta-helix repeat protein
MIVNNTAESSGGGLMLRYGAQATIYGCTFSGNLALETGWGGGGITCEHGADAVIRNTILWNDYPQEIHIGGWQYSTIDIDYCDIQGGEADIIISEQQPSFDHVIYGEMNLIAHPLFKNPGNNDFHISLLSPCVDAGNITYIGEQDTDIDGESRVYDIPWITYPGRDPVDIGADEVCTLVIRGDCNGDKIITIGDVVYLINYLYKNSPAPEPLEAGDANSDTLVDIGDVVYLINYLFKDGNPPL